MIGFLIGMVIGLMLGACAGVVIGGLLLANGDPDDATGGAS